MNAKIAYLEVNYIEALKWFESNAGRTITWLQPTAEGVCLMNNPKGINRPAGFDFTLSVRAASMTVMATVRSGVAMGLAAFTITKNFEAIGRTPISIEPTLAS